MVKYDLPRRTNEDVQLIERADGRYYSVTEVDAEIRKLEKRLRRTRAVVKTMYDHPIGRRMMIALGFSTNLLNDLTR